MIHGEYCVPEMNDKTVEEQTFTWIDSSAFVADDHGIPMSLADPERNQRAKIRGRNSVAQICELMAVRFYVPSFTTSTANHPF
ncbi:MAG: hypothetical protein ABJZ55_22880 [Fuerstiella sp.]